MPAKRINNIVMENARIIFRNFSGAESSFNRAGDRNFCVVIPDAALAEELKNDGWNVKERTSQNDPDAEPFYYIRVNVKFGQYPPKVVAVNRGVNTVLTEETIGILDNADISSVDLTIRPYSWNAQGRSGISAYLQVLYANLVEADPFYGKYNQDQQAIADRHSISEDEEEIDKDNLPF